MKLTTKTLGSSGPTVSALGLGAMGMSGSYGASDDNESIRTVHAALDAGVTLIDTGDFYGFGHNEMLLSRALHDRDRDDYVLSVKFGALREPRGGFTGFDGRPAAVANSLGYSLTRLGVDHIDIYRPGRLDPVVPIEETIGAIAEQVGRGTVRHIGLSEVGSETIRRAAAVHPISDLQIEYSVLSRGLEGGILDTCRELGIGITAYGVLSRGLIGTSRLETDEQFSGAPRSIRRSEAGEKLRGVVTRRGRASRAPISPRTCSWSSGCGRLPHGTGSRCRSWRSRGSLRRATTSCRWSG